MLKTTMMFKLPQQIQIKIWLKSKKREDRTFSKERDSSIIIQMETIMKMMMRRKKNKINTCRLTLKLTNNYLKMILLLRIELQVTHQIYKILENQLILNYHHLKFKRIIKSILDKEIFNKMYWLRKIYSILRTIIISHLFLHLHIIKGNN